MKAPKRAKGEISASKQSKMQRIVKNRPLNPSAKDLQQEQNTNNAQQKSKRKRKKKQKNQSRELVRPPAKTPRKPRAVAKKKKKLKQMDSNKKKVLAKPPAQTVRNSCTNHRQVKYYLLYTSTRYRLISPLTTLFFFAQMLIAGHVAPRKSAKKRKSRWKRNLRCQRFKHCVDTSFLLCHCMLEAYTILSCIHFYTLQEWDATSLHRANGSLAVCMIGVYMLWRRNRDGIGSKVLFWVLAEYRIISLLVKLLCNGKDSNQAMHYSQNHWNIPALSLDNHMQHIASLGHMTWAKKTDIPSPTDDDIVSEFISTFMQMGSAKFEQVSRLIVAAAAETSNPEEAIRLALDMTLFCWFALRAVTKL